MLPPFVPTLGAVEGVFTPASITLTTTSANQNVAIPLHLNDGTTGERAYVDWGDGSNPDIITASFPGHTYTTPGSYDIEISGQGYWSYGNIYYVNAIEIPPVPASCDESIVTAIIRFGNYQFKAGAFSFCNNLTSIPNEQWKAPEDITSFFYYAGAYNDADIDFTVSLTNWDTSDVVHMDGFMAYMEENNTAVDVSGWDVTKVKSMYEAFGHGYDRTSLNITGWDTSNIEDFSDAFAYQGANAFWGSTATGWDDTANLLWQPGTIAGADSLDFSSARYVYQVFTVTYIVPPDITGWEFGNYADNPVEFDASYMFNYVPWGADRTVVMDTTSWDWSRISMWGMFRGCQFVDEFRFPTTLPESDKPRYLRPTQLFEDTVDARDWPSTITGLNEFFALSVNPITHLNQFSNNTRWTTPPVLDGTNWPIELVHATSAFTGSNLSIQNIDSWDVSNASSFYRTWDGNIGTGWDFTDLYSWDWAGLQPNNTTFNTQYRMFTPLTTNMTQTIADQLYQDLRDAAATYGYTSPNAIDEYRLGLGYLPVLAAAITARDELVNTYDWSIVYN